LTKLSPTKICLNCGCLFRPKPYRAERARFCSHKCRASLSLKQHLVIIGWTVDENGCWLWNGTITPEGYGQFGCNGKYYRAHRASWEVFVGPIPEYIDVLHSCDVRNCINQDHLFLGTDADNAADRARKGRSALTHGSLNGNSKLLESEVREIILSQDSGVNLASKFGVSSSLIYLIKLRKVWRHVA